jgi:predicted membrane protein DUF2231
MLDLVDGLPVHILVVHAVVVLIPLMALVTVAFTIRPKWRPGLGWAVLGNLVATGAAFVAKEAGENLQTRLSNQLGQPVATDHAELGDKLPWFAVALLVASVVAWVLTRADGAGRARVGTALVLVVVTGVLAGWWTFRTGDSGSRAVWEDTIANTQAP